jgi:hypothetical protein
MKQKLFVLLLLVLGAATAPAQFTKGSWELGLLSSFGSSSLEGSDESQSYFYVSVIPAYYIIDGLAIEPEIGITADLDNSDNSYFKFIGNLAYTFKLSGNTSPFVRVGYGISNGIELPYSTGIGLGDDDVHTNILQFGAGAKILVGQKAAIRLELDYRSQTFSESRRSSDMTMTNIGMNIGVSLLF